MFATANFAVANMSNTLFVFDVLRKICAIDNIPKELRVTTQKHTILNWARLRLLPIMNILLITDKKQNMIHHYILQILKTHEFCAIYISSTRKIVSKCFLQSLWIEIHRKKRINYSSNCVRSTCTKHHNIYI